MSKMAAVRAILSKNPKATPTEIVAILAKQKMKMSEGVASNYKSIIKNKRKRRKKNKGAPVAVAMEATAGPEAHGLEPAVVDLLKAGKELGWNKVRSIAELMEG
jgi:hypothetical protein